MESMRLHQTGPIDDSPLRQESVTSPEPQGSQIRLNVLVCGVCHTDLHTVEGDLDLPKLPVTPGHQVVGVVDKLGPDAVRFQAGQRVGVAWLNWTCRKCEYCTNGMENLCPNARFTGLHADGGYGQQMVVDELYAYPLPEDFSDEEAAPLLCAGIVGFRALRLSGIQPGQRLGLFGFGASAHLVIQVAVHWGCEVYVFTRSKHHRDLARDLGAVWVGGAEDEVPKLLQAGVIFAPVGWIVPLALDKLAPGGTLAINAIHMSPIPELNYEQIYRERIMRSVANFTREDAKDFLSLAASIPIRTVVEQFPLREANKVLRMLKRSEIRGSAALRVAAS